MHSPLRSAPARFRLLLLLGVGPMAVAGCSLVGVGPFAGPDEPPPTEPVEDVPLDTLPAGPDVAEPTPDTAVADTAAVAPPDTAAAAADSLALAPDTAAVAEDPCPVESILAALTLREKVGQMIMPWILGDFSPAGSAGHDRLVELIEDHEVGGVIVSVGAPVDVAVKLNDLQRRSEVPLLVAADLETGAGFRFSGILQSPTNILLGGATDFPSLMAVGATDDPRLAYEMGRVTAIEARAVGVHVPFAPVLDVNSNPDNPIINVRSFGEDPLRVAALGTAFVRGVQEHGAIATGKHFPGHGDTDTDSHLSLPIIRAPKARLEGVELVPFRDAIAAGMGGVMTAHIAVPVLNDGDPEPSTLSHPVLTGLLREELGFDGLIFTDAMDMGAIDDLFSREEAAVRAVEAGADVILMPPSIERAIDGIVRAVWRGRVLEDRIDTSVRRILEAKERLGLLDDPVVPPSGVSERVGIPRHLEVARTVAERSITLLRNGRDVLPLLGTRSADVLSITYRRENDLLAGRYFDGGLRAVYPRLDSEHVFRNSDDEVYDDLLRQARRSNLVVVGLYVTAVSYSGSVAVPEEMSDFIQRLASDGIPHVVVSFGNPYLLREFPDAQAYVLAWSGTAVSQRAAVDALFGRFDIRGRTPTRIPPFFEIGDGIQLRRESR